MGKIVKNDGLCFPLPHSCVKRGYYFLRMEGVPKQGRKTSAQHTHLMADEKVPSPWWQNWVSTISKK